MENILVKEKDIVVPGQILAKGMDYLPAYGTYRDGDEIKALQVGTINISGRLIKLIPLKGPYIPRVGDVIVGKVREVGTGGWLVDIGFGDLAGLSVRDATLDYIPREADLNNYYKHGDYIVAKITKVTKDKLINLTTREKGMRKLDEGIIIQVSPVKVPRIIGKGGSMISMIKEKTDCRIMVGQNGIIWLSGLDPNKEKIAVETINFIEENAHKEGLTDIVKDRLESKFKPVEEPFLERNVHERKPREEASLKKNLQEEKKESKDEKKKR